MFRNLDAEQARKGHSNSDTAAIIGISRISFEAKKKSGKFNRHEIARLMHEYGCSFEYLMEYTNEPDTA